MKAKALRRVYYLYILLFFVLTLIYRVDLKYL